MLALAVLAATLSSAIVRRRRLPEWAVAIAGAAALVAVGAISLHGARRACGDLGSTVAFLAALLVLSEGCRRQGVFEALGAVIARASAGRATQLFGLVFLASAAVTVLLGLDATIVLLTPIVLVTAARARAAPKPPVYTCAHLANSASLLLPVSNLTNLLAFHASRLSFTRFAVVMALPWALAVLVEWLGLRRFFARELAVETPAAPDKPAAPETAATPETAAAPETAATRNPTWPFDSTGLGRPGGYALFVLGGTLLGFGLSSPLGVAPLWFAVGGALLIALPSLVDGRAQAVSDFVRAAQPGFLVFVFALGVIVRAAADHGLRSAVVTVLPSGDSAADLILVAVIGAVAANVLNNLPATLILVPVAGGIGLGPLLAVLVGVNLGPNLSYGGSLATLLWRRIVPRRDVLIELGEFTRLGALTVVPALPLAAAALWLSVKLLGP